jgi:uncharacterized protein
MTYTKYDFIFVMDLLLVCPITKERLYDPVICADGHTYERTAIQKWFNSGKSTSPMTGMKLENLTLIPNILVKQIVAKLKPEIIDLT